MLSDRLSSLRRSLQQARVKALAVAPGPSLTYLTGLHFHISERPVLAYFTADADPVIILPELEMLKLEALPFKIKAFPYGEDPSGWDALFLSAGRSLGLQGQSIGVEPRYLRVLEFRYILALAGSALCPDVSELVGVLRLHKDAQEIEYMRQAVRIAQDALETTLGLAHIGMTEADLAGELVAQLLRHGSEPDLPFSPIVSSGPNGANPHAVPSSRRLSPGDLLVVDWGAASGGYISDLTRTFAVGQVDPEYIRIHQVVLEANTAGRLAGKPGLPCSVVDSAARTVIEKAGYGEFFTHRTGHGIGLEAHEDPYMRGDNSQLLEEGMAYTVEPGIYLPGRNGVRIEDNLVVGKEGSICLTNMPRELRVIG